MATIAKTEDEKKAQSKDEKEKREQRIESLKSILAHLSGQPYYVGHLDLSHDNLARWLDASHNCVLLAAARLRASIEHVRKVSKTQSDPGFAPSAVMKRHFGGGMCGVDRQGSPVYILLFGKTDMLGMSQSCNREQFMVFWAHRIHSMIDQIKKQNKRNETSIAYNILLIVDFKDCENRDLNWSALAGWAKAAQTYEDLNPGLFKEILLINPPWSVAIIHRVITSFLKPSTRRKVALIGRANTLRHLLLRIDKHEIPAYLGGYKCDTDNNPYCLQNIHWPQKVPRWSHLTNPSLPSDVVDVVVPMGSVFKIHVTVSVPDSRITWRLFNVKHPIRFELTPPAPPPAPDTCRDPLVKPRPLYSALLDAEKVQQGGLVSCPVAGVYSLVLDNRKNMNQMVRAKVKVEVLNPDGYLGRFEEHTPLGDAINFFEPVTREERRQRKLLYQSCTDCDMKSVKRFF